MAKMRVPERGSEEERDLALSIGSRMLSQAFHFPETPLPKRFWLCCSEAHGRFTFGCSLHL